MSLPSRIPPAQKVWVLWTSAPSASSVFQHGHQNLMGSSADGAARNEKSPASTLDRVLQVDEVAALLGVVPRTVAEWARAGDIPGFKVGRNWLFFEDTLLAHLRDREAK